MRYYAVLGLLLVLPGNVKRRTLAWAGVMVTLCAQPLLRPWLLPLLPAPLPADQAMAAALAAFSGDSPSTLLGANLEYDMHRRVAGWSLAFFVLGRLLLGAAPGHAGVLRQPQWHLAFWRRLLVVALPLGIACTAFMRAGDHGLLFAEGWWKGQGARVISSVLRNASSLALALAYMALAVLLFQRPRWRGWLARFAPVGRMALSNYLAQTVFGIALFYGIGLGLGPRHGLAGTLLAAVAIFTAQTAASRWWLRRFNFGPAEWLWRSLTYGRRQPLRRRPAPALPAAG